VGIRLSPIDKSHESTSTYSQDGGDSPHRHKKGRPRKTRRRCRYVLMDKRDQVEVVTEQVMHRDQVCIPTWTFSGIGSGRH
jgi:hypothetical protein